MLHWSAWIKCETDSRQMDIIDNRTLYWRVTHGEWRGGCLIQVNRLIQLRQNRGQTRWKNKKHLFVLTVQARKTFELKVLIFVREINMENLTWEIIIVFFVFFGVFTLSGRTIQVETIQTSSWDSVKGDHDRLITVAHKEVKIKILEEKQFRNKFRNFDQYGAP